MYVISRDGTWHCYVNVKGHTQRANRVLFFCIALNSSLNPTRLTAIRGTTQGSSH